MWACGWWTHASLVPSENTSILRLTETGEEKVCEARNTMAEAIALKMNVADGIISEARSWTRIGEDSFRVFEKGSEQRNLS